MIGEATQKGGDRTRALDATGNTTDSKQSPLPAVALPKGGGAIRGIGEKFATNPATGTGSLSVPIFASPGRSGFTPQLAISYDSGAGNGPFGFGWSLSIPKVTRKTDKGIPRYRDEEESDVFILSEAEDLVPELRLDGTILTLSRTWDGRAYRIRRYRPRVEGLFARIERWQDDESHDVHWRAVTKDNITSIYGDSSESRISDPVDESRVFSWLLARSYDDKGNLIVYEYKKEDERNVPFELHERNREHTANLYLKRIYYGHQTPYFPAENPATPSDWHFQVLFDYGEHDLARPTVEEDQDWEARPDPFSSYRAGFEIRTHRRCRRALVFHHFAELGETPCLVRSTDFSYAEQGEPTPEKSLIASFITSATQAGYIRRGADYEKQIFPPVEFTYTEVKIDDTVHTADRASLENMPSGLDGSRYRWVDLDGEGVSGTLTKQAGAWYYKRNLSPLTIPAESEVSALATARFAPVEVVKSQPASSGSTDDPQLLDLAGDGQIDLVLDGPVSGFYERTDNEGWESFKPFVSTPNIDWNNPNLRFVDLSGDGHADILITEEDAFTWYPSLGEEGFGPATRVSLPVDEDAGPRLAFADGTSSIYLADMSGDGLNDLLRIRNGDVCYWPNLGYGRFGAKVTMSGAPVFDYQDSFDQKRLRIADIDGSGISDLIYLGRDAVRIYFNRSGNSWSPPVTLEQFPTIDSLASVEAMDLLGNGTACLVWSSSLPANALEPMRYIDLMGSTKPHLLVTMANNLGAETRVRYVPSTKFYLEDRAAGKPWPTRLPFPVHVVDQVEVFDHVSKTKFVSNYKYHHGYFDGPEREFRGFGKVEQWDTQTFSRFSGGGLFTETPATEGEEFHLPPVRTVTWFHTGAFISLGNITRHYETEYYQGDPAAELLPDTTLPGELTSVEASQACRALKGSVLRQEIYAEDNSDQSPHPYSVTEHAYKLRMLQPSGNSHHAVFYAYQCESLAYHYERNPTDPRIGHQLTLEVDVFGNVTKSASIGYARRLSPDRQPEQEKTYITFTENRFVNKPDEDDWYRLGLPVETRTYELTGASSATTLLNAEAITNVALSAAEIAYEVTPADVNTEKRLIEHVRTLYRRDDLTGPLPLGEVDSLALPYESYTLALTSGLVSQVYGDRVTNTMLEEEGRYVHSEGDANWWIPSGHVFLSPERTFADLPDAAEVEVAFARNHFFLPHCFRDPFTNTATVLYDNYSLLATEARDAVGNVVTSKNHYRTLSPQLVTDPNRNRTAARFDALGMITAAFVMGKAGQNEGDRFDETSDEATLQDDPTARSEYDLFNWATRQKPVFVHSSAREQHGLLNPRWQETYGYSDGLGREIEHKIQAEPGDAPLRDAEGAIILDANEELASGFTESRWVGNGRTVFDNKGNVIKKYEPFFDSTREFVVEEELVTFGITLVMRYDPLGQLVRMDLPDGTFTKVEFDSWHHFAWDENDNVLGSRWYLERGSPNPEAEEPSSAHIRAAWQAAKHAGTPTVTHFDSLARVFLKVVDNGPAPDGSSQRYETRSELDINGNQRALTDPLGRTVMQYEYDMLGMLIHQLGMDAGERRALSNTVGNVVYSWDSRSQVFNTKYDALHRSTHLYLQAGSDPQTLLERTFYGEVHPDSNSSSPDALQSCSLNLRGRVFLSLDSAGALVSGTLASQPDTLEAYDFKGNLLQGERRFAREYKRIVDWSVVDAQLTPATILSLEVIEDALAPLIEAEHFSQSSSFDALNRVTTLTAPDRSLIRPAYSNANLLEHLTLNLHGVDAETNLVEKVDYNAKGQQLQVTYGNGVITTCDYDPQTFRLLHLRTTRSASALQDLSYSYDPVGNITTINDDAQQPVFFNNEVVQPGARYVYDALYRLIDVAGREHIGQTANDSPQHHPEWKPHYDSNDSTRVNLAHPHDGQAMRSYSEEYEYDAVGNIVSMIHRANQGTWTRRYQYDGNSNRLLRTSLPGDSEDGPFSAVYDYDAHGNITRMPHIAMMGWNFKDQLAATRRQAVNDGVGETTYYVYDGAGQRTRKVTERQAIAGAEPAPKNERFYLAGFEVYREYVGSSKMITLERETLHIMNGKQRVALVDTKTFDETDVSSLPQTLTRFQLSDHLGSSSLELDEQALIISYEEYYPYGSTSYQAARNGTEAKEKRYRYTGKERDEENQFYYQGTRYYAPWLARWTSADPLGVRGGINLYLYCGARPILMVDPNGTSAVTAAQPGEKPVISGKAPPLERAPKAPVPGPNIQVSEPIGKDAAGNLIYPENLEGIDDTPPEERSTGGGGFLSGWEAQDPADREVEPLESPDSSWELEFDVIGMGKKMLGFGLGVLQAVAPLGWLWGPGDTGDRDIDMGRGLGELAGGLGEMAMSLKLLGAGIGATSTGIGIPVGALALTLGLALAAEGYMDSTTGIDRYHRAEKRRTWQESEKMTENGWGSQGTGQQSFLNGHKISKRAKGSGRPDVWVDHLNLSVEVKNYDLSRPGGKSGLIADVVKQANERQAKLPAGSKQALVLDVGGQNIPDDVLEEVIKGINKGSGNIFEDRWWIYMD